MIDKNKLLDAVVCDENCSILEVSRILRDTKSRHLIVVDEKLKPLGVISVSDINNRVVSEELEPSETSASKIMTKNIDVIDVKESYDVAYKKMVARGSYSIPVVENGKLVGLLDFNQLFGKLKEERK